MKTNTTRDTVINFLLTDPHLENCVKGFLDNKYERDEFRQHLWLIILEFDHDKLIQSYDTNNIKGLIVSICKNQIWSKTSPWHKQHRNPKYNFDEMDAYEEMPDDFDEVFKKKTLDEQKIKYIEDALKKMEKKKPRNIRDISVFKMHYYDGMSYRAIQKKTNIPLINIFIYIKNVKDELKNKLPIL